MCPEENIYIVSLVFNIVNFSTTSFKTFTHSFYRHSSFSVLCNFSYQLVIEASFFNFPRTK